MLSGDVHQLKVPKGTGQEQHGTRYGVIVQANEFLSPPPRQRNFGVSTTRY